jgi:hypothetical protein
MEPTPLDSLDVPALLEISEPRGSTPWAWYAIGAGILLAGINELLSDEAKPLKLVFGALSGVAIMVILFALMIGSLSAMRAMRAQERQLDGVAEMMQLHRWPQAAIALRQMLSQPARSAHFRIQALVYFTTVLARYDRFDDAVMIQEYLLDHGLVDPTTAFGLRIGRTMAMLRQDRLFDADRAISDLRRTPGAAESAGVALVELYRDVKTGHPTEAIEIFQRKLPILREQLGHRVADAWALVGRAYDLLGREGDARMAIANATLLAPPAELLRRYPELEKLTGRFQPAPMPAA